MTAVTPETASEQTFEPRPGTLARRLAALLADAACRGAVYNVRINIASLDDKSRGAGLVEEANQLLAKTRRFVDDATGAVERAIG